MKFMIDDLPVLFPYESLPHGLDLLAGLPMLPPRPVTIVVVHADKDHDYSYMCDLKKTLDAGMPSGTGKTVSLLSLIISYMQFYGGEKKRKLIYCSRTVPEIEKALAELKRLMEYREDMGAKDTGFRGLGLTSRKNLCLNPEEKKGKVVDSRCRDMTSSFACEKGRADPGSVQLCSWHEELNNYEPGHLIPEGVWTLDDVKKYGQEKGVCPYFTIRRMMPYVDVIIYSFHYLLDPKVAEQVSAELSKEAIVVFDEAHNIAARSVAKIGDKIDEIKKSDAEKLNAEYQKLVDGLAAANDRREEDDMLSNPVLSEDMIQEAIPGNIRKAEHFIAFLKRFIEYLKTRMRVLHVVAETPQSFMAHLKEITFIEKRPLQFCAERLTSLIRTLELTNLDEHFALQKIASFGTLVATYEKGFLLILEPYETEHATVPNPIFHFTCLDPSLAMAPVFERFSSVIITSGTISPLDMYPKMLQFQPVIQESYPMTLTRNAFLPMVITRGSDQVPISSRFEVRNDPAVVRNFGSILIDMAKTVPDGVVAFFPSYLYMESIVSAWYDMGILSEVWKHKLLFVETPDAMETSIALKNYREACNNGRGAVLLSVARGKVSEGIDFDHNYGRAVIMFGIPYQYTESRILKARLEFLRDNHRIRENDYLTFDAMRHAAQCVGRVLRGKTDWGLMVFADKDKRAKLPRWINQYITDAHSNLSTDMAVVLAKKFIRNISQPFDHTQTGISLWTLEDIEERQRKDREEAERAGAMVDDAFGPSVSNGDKAPEDVDMDGHFDIDDAALAAVDMPD
ncbi:general RNA polymerase II transcription factor [Trichosporon asahii var. asahii CBS 2479]|uniref:DNA 5'-3' helicase n=1 Tax=Trichosporon asahii var. asahii (strain ATCC 90039 / CBS 2479 / JCM 2466 / KCTC 7840 / NBRC 103889/ NCYC 2677 / UAMH 7654) TaxID=1186058 RepID=J5SQJ6_TRIAS|nr:general RNA polymerase II transcription factor [Trichosporon asahii var. asahii CBS 2479]EJT46976.1 general RNA polymerase II transcription factor [Trichosporon asahii var. asahii CBS 2479]